MRRYFLSFAFIASLSFLFNPADAAVQKANELTFSLKGDIHSADPYGLYEVITTGFLYNVYDTLVSRDKDLKIIPCLAESWISKSPTLMEMKLRQNVKFHEGEAFTADDVIFSYKRSISEGSDVKAVIASVKDIRKVDDFTVEVETHSSNPTLLAELYGLMIMSKSWCEKHDATKVAQLTKNEKGYADLHANGTGPFKLEKREPEIQTILLRNHNWWGKFEGNIERAIFKPIANDATRIAGLVTGELDLIAPVPLQDKTRVEAVPSLEIITKPSLTTIYMVLNVGVNELPSSGIKGKNPLQDIRVREAIYRAIDIEAIQKKIMQGTSKPTALMIGPGIHGYDADLDKRLPYDPELSKKLLAEAGYSEGFKMAFDTSNDRYIKDEAIAQALAAMLRKVGITLTLNSTTKSKYFAKVLGGDTESYLMGWMPGTYDALDPYSNLCETKGKYNIGKYSNPKLDEMIQKAQVELDDTKRQEYVREILQIQQKDMAQIPLHQESLVWGKRKNVNVVQRADDYLCMLHLFSKN